MKKSLSEYFEEGYVAFSMVTRRNGKFHQTSNPIRSNNPHTFISHREWQRGWNAAYFENLEKLNGLGARS